MQDAELFRADAYRRSCDATIIEITDDAVILDQTVFYPTGGGQPGDRGQLTAGNGQQIDVTGSRKADTAGLTAHIVGDDHGLKVGDPIQATIDWDYRFRLMRMHTALHLLCRAVDGAVTGGQIGDVKSRLDFDIPEPSLDKDAIAQTVNRWVEDDRTITSRWISAAELEASPDLVRTMKVRPPTSGGMVRLVEIETIDLQACGGTHVASTAEIGRIKVAKIEKKGRQNRRVSIVFDT